MTDTETKQYQIDTYEGTWTEEEWDGTEKVPVDLTYAKGVTTVTCNIYYDSSGVLELRVTRKPEDALRLFVALLREDTKIEGEHK